MKKTVLFAMIFMCCAALTASAQSWAQDMPVKFKGAQPTIRDFITALVAPTYGEDGEMDESMNYLRDVGGLYIDTYKWKNGKLKQTATKKLSNP